MFANRLIYPEGIKCVLDENNFRKSGEGDIDSKQPHTCLDAQCAYSGIFLVKILKSLHTVFDDLRAEKGLPDTALSRIFCGILLSL